MSWTDDRVAKLKKLWAEGLSASQIAMQIGGVNRNAVIGKVHRLGLSGRANPTIRGSLSKTRPRRSKHPRPPSAPYARFLHDKQQRETQAQTSPCATGGGSHAHRPMVHEPYTSRFEDVVIPEHERKQLVDLDDKDCRWPIGDPQHADFHFCGWHQITGLPYCEFHARVAYMPPVTSTRHPKREQAERVRTFEKV